MRLKTIAGIVTLSGAAASLSYSSPWVLLSTSKFQDASHHNQIRTSSAVVTHTKEILATCPTDRYLVVTQPGIHATDLGRAGRCSMPHLCRAVEDSRVQGRYTVSDVVGDVMNAAIAEHIRSACTKKHKAVIVDEVSLTPLPSEDRDGALFDNDAILGSSLEAATQNDSYTILFFSTPGEPIYEPKFFSTLHMDLRRDMGSLPVRRAENNTQRDTRPLFEKYQFFTPGIFMGIIVALVLVSILVVGLKALSSLEVSYGAFDKQMGPAAHKKLQ